MGIVRVCEVCVPTDRNEKTARAFAAPEEIAREQLQPSVVTVEGYILIFPPLTSAPELREPGVLCCKRGGGVAFGEVENEVEERWNGAGREGFDARHGDGWRSCVRGERDGGAFSDETICLLVEWLVCCALGVHSPLHKGHGAIFSKHEIAPQRINDHEDHLVERCMILFSRSAVIIPVCKTRQDRFVRKEAGREYKNCKRE